VEGYGHREIAALLKCSAGNSKSQLHKARMRIREFLRATRPVPAPARTANRSSRSGASITVLAPSAPARDSAERNQRQTAGNVLPWGGPGVWQLLEGQEG
jgi:hypothetical protein